MNQTQLKFGPAWRLASACVLLLSLVTQASAVGQDTKGNSKSKHASKPLPVKATTTKAAIPRLTQAEEDKALAFAKQHHPELAKLLEQLRSKSTIGFSRGTREIHQAAQRLERFREKQPARFESELKNWQLDSEIRLLTAKWTMSQDAKLVDRIQVLLRNRQVAKIDRLKAERSRLAERLQQLDQQIGMGTDELEADLAAEWQQLAKRSTTAAKVQKNRTKAAAETGTTSRVKQSKTNKTEAASKAKARND